MPDRWKQSWPVEEHREGPDPTGYEPQSFTDITLCKLLIFFKPIIFWMEKLERHVWKEVVMQVENGRAKIQNLSLNFPLHYAFHFPQALTWSQGPYAADTQLQTNLLILPGSMTFRCKKQFTIKNK